MSSPLKTFRVLITSSDSKRLKIFVFPMHMDDIIRDRIDIDLSEGTFIKPFSGLLLKDLRVNVFFILNYDI